jgi:LuxR family maltose regulon positive regulatory protein
MLMGASGIANREPNVGDARAPLGTAPAAALRVISTRPSATGPIESVHPLEWLLPTKLRVPDLGRPYDVRTRLQARLATGLQRPLTVVAAPAGFGKTNLLATWLISPEGAAHRLAWVTLDATDNVPARFWGYVVAGLQDAEPALGTAAQTILSVPGSSSEAIAASLVHDLSGLDVDIVLVLDNYDVIEAEPIQRGLTLLLEQAPARFHVVVLSRTEPALPLARLRTRGQVVEIGAEQLRFDVPETARFLAETLREALPDETVEALAAATEGWPAGVQLATLTVDGSGEPTELLARFDGGHRYVVDYLVEEVLRRQSEPVQQFLLQTAILDRLSGGLCDAVTSGQGGQAMLVRLERASLFLAPLGEDRRWYRYHLLFGEALRQHLRTVDPDLVAVLHTRAAAWFEAHGLLREAVEHSIKAGDWPTAVRCIEPQVVDLTESGERATLNRWLAAIPETALRTNLMVALARATTLLLSGQMEAAERLGRWVQARAEECGDVVAQGCVDAFRSNLEASRGDGPAALEAGRRALERLPEQARQRRSIALLGSGSGHMLLGMLDDAAADLEHAASLTFSEAAGLTIGASALSQLGHVRQLQGDVAEAERLYRDVLYRRGKSVTFARARALIRLGDVLRERNELDEATVLAQEGIRLDKQSGGRDLHEGYVLLARILGAQGQLDNALDAMANAEAAAGRLRHATAAARTYAYGARLRLNVGDARAAVRWSNGCRLSDDDLLRYEHEVEALTLVRAWIAQGQAEDALTLLGRLRPLAEAAGRMASTVEMLTLEALAWTQADDHDQALACLTQAVGLAEPAGYVRLFVDEGVPMSRLFEALSAAQRRGPGQGPVLSGGYLRRLLGAFTGQTPEPATVEATSRDSLAYRLSEPLSRREIEVLQLMVAGASNQQIADRLVVAITTVKTHINGIFRKLDATSRLEAATRARELNLLGQSVWAAPR